MKPIEIQNKTVIVKVTPDCDLECAYCYYHPSCDTNGGQPTVMSKDLLERLIEQVLSTVPGNIDFIWHGGEPLLAGKGFYEAVLELQKCFVQDDERIVVNSLQTNATLLNDKWIDFLCGNDFEIGISIDGPKHIHDRFRVDGLGRGSYETVMAALKSLLDREANFGLLAVVTQYSTKYPDEVFDFFVSNGLNHFDFLTCVDIDPVTKRPSQYSVRPQDFADFMIRIFDIWMERDDPSISIRYLESILALMMGGKASLCEFAGTCSGFITVDYLGNVYPCDCLIEDGPFLFGNLLDTSLADILTGDPYRKFLVDLKAQPSVCANCEWFNVCQAGCSHHRFAFNQTFDSRNYFCGARRQIIEHVAAKVDSILERAKQLAADSLQDERGLCM